MVVYVVFCKDYEHRKCELIGMLVERRKDMRGQTQLDSGTKWARLAFGHLVEDKKDIFIYPKEMKVDNEKELLINKAIFTKEEFWEVMKTVDHEVGAEGKELNRTHLGPVSV